ncbi:hypothetical protein FJY71_00925 [candidate division WOR-3 bacterium]|nr:hypothetical protein [candidate division WOR-3 bacterium]
MCGCTEQQVVQLYHDCSLNVRSPGRGTPNPNRPDYCPSCGQRRYQFIVYCPGCSSMTTYPYVKPGRIPPPPLPAPGGAVVTRASAPRPAARKPKKK